MPFPLRRYLNGRWVDAYTGTPVVADVIKASFGATASALVVALNGSASTANSGQAIVSYSWDFGDNNPLGSGKTVTHTYNSPGTYSVALTVTDSGGASNTATRAVTVKSVALDYLADPAPLFNQFLHPASATSVAQCIVQSPDTGEWYMSQVHPESTASFTNTDSMRISRMAADGTLLDQMLCTYGGHGTSIGLEYVNGQMFIWATYYEPVAGTSRVHDIVRFPYSAGTFTRAQIAGLQVKLAGGIYRRIQFDWRNGYCLLTEDPTWKRFRIADVLSGVFTSPVNTITVNVNPPTLQGLATYGDSVFYFTGDGASTVAQGATAAGGPFTFYEKSWTTGGQVQKVDLSQTLADASGNYAGGRVEPESCTIYDPAPGANPVVNIGMVTGLAGTTHTFYVYSFDLINQSDVVAGRTFELRETKPTPANVGAGILRPVTNVHNGDLTITQNNFLLADTTVNGKVVVAAANVVIENCFIKGPVTNPGAATVNPVWIVDTDSAAVANGPALIRYSTITGNWRSPNLYGVGDRNYTLEYCDVSKVVEGARATAAATGGDASTLIRGNYIHDLIFYCPDPTNPTNVGATNVAGDSLSGTWAGKNWNWASGVHLLNNNSTGIQIYGNNIVANWSTDAAASTLPLPPAYARLNAVRISAGTNIPVEDNWLDGGEYCLYMPGSTTTGNVARNRFGRAMAHYSTTDVSYFAMSIASSTVATNDASSVDRNVWQDTSATAYRSGSAPAPTPDDRSNLVPGTYLPDATTTGLLPGYTKAQLRVVTGSNGTLALSSGDLYENCWITARVLKPPTGSATLRNCWIDGGTYSFSTGVDTGLVDASGNNGGAILVEDCHLEAVTPGLHGNGITGFNYAIRRSHIRHVVDGCNVSNTTSPGAATNVLIEACLVHDLAYFTPDPTHADNHSHNDAVQIFGGSGTRIHGNNLQAMIDTTITQGSQSVFGAIASGQALAYTPTQSVAITATEAWGNFLDGGQQSVTAIPGNGPTGKDIGYIHDNTFGTNQVSKTEASDSTARKRPILIDASLLATGISPIGSGAISKVDTNGNTGSTTGTAITDYVLANAT